VREKTQRRIVALVVSIGAIAGAPAHDLLGQESSGDVEEGAETTVLDGVYTEAQAREGRSEFSQNCSYCHVVREFSGDRWIGAWSGSSVEQFYDLIRNTMPFDGPGRLSPEQYARVVAYILEQNGFPPGEEELPTDEDRLEAIRIVEPAQEEEEEGGR